MEQIADYFTPTQQKQEAIHQLAFLKQGKKTAEEVITEFRLSVARTGLKINLELELMPTLAELMPARLKKLKSRLQFLVSCKSMVISPF